MFNPEEFEDNLCSKLGIYWILAVVFVILLLPVVMVQCMKAFEKKPTGKELCGKVVLITGASSGFGEALAHEFFKKGCKLILSSRNEEALERVRKDMMKKAEGIKDMKTYPPVILPLDLTDLNAIQPKAEMAIATHGRIDFLVNNAGISYRGEAVNTSVNVDIKLMMVNYFGQIALTKAILPSMITRKKGHVVFVSSVQGLMALPNRSAYGASKHALQGFSDSLRAELAEKKIKVTVLSPGFMKTKLSENALTGNGQVYGVMDKATARGSDPNKVAAMTVKAIMQDQKEIVIARTTPKFAIFIRHFFPKVYFFVMELKAKPKPKK